MSSQPVPVLKGGAAEQTLDLLQKYAQPFIVYVGILLVVGIAYIGQIPESIAYQANTILGRLTLFLLTILVADTYSWIYGFLMALFSALLIAMAPRTQSAAEGFQAYSKQGGVDVKLVSQKKKWWVEEVLQENPIGIEDEKVRTSAIQDSSNSSNSTQSSNSPS